MNDPRKAAGMTALSIAAANCNLSGVQYQKKEDQPSSRSYIKRKKEFEEGEWE